MQLEILFLFRDRLSRAWQYGCKIVAIGCMVLGAGLGLAGWGGGRAAGAADRFQAAAFPGPGLIRGTGTVAPGPTVQTTPVFTATLPTLAPTITPTATFIPLPAITFQAAQRTPTQGLLILERPPGALPGPPKEDASRAALFLRRWGALLALGGLWIGLALWVGIVILLARKAEKP